MREQLTQEETIQFNKAMMERMAGRYVEHALISEIDFLFGVLSAMTYLFEGEEPDQIWRGSDAAWLLGVLAGRSPLASHLANGDEKEEARIQREIDRKELLVKGAGRLFDFATRIWRDTSMPQRWLEYAAELLESIDPEWMEEALEMRMQERLQAVRDIAD